MAIIDRAKYVKEECNMFAAKINYASSQPAAPLPAKYTNSS